MKRFVTFSGASALLGLIVMLGCKKSEIVKEAVTYPPTVEPTPISLKLIPVGSVSEFRFGMTAATFGNKIFFAGGYDYKNQALFSKVDIYDWSTDTWSKAELSEPRSSIASAVAGNKILFAGGIKDVKWENSGWDYGPVYTSSSRVDIYDVSTEAWTTTEMPESLHFTNNRQAAVVGNKVFFAGSHDQEWMDKVYIYDLVTNSWTSAPTSVSRSGLATAVSGNQVFFAGGFTGTSTSEKVDVYEAATGTWSIEHLSLGRSEIKAIYLNDKIFFAGGISTDDLFRYYGGPFTVDIFNKLTKKWDKAILSPLLNTFSNAVSFDQKALFFSDKQVYVYNDGSHSWHIADLEIVIPGGDMRPEIISTANGVYVAGTTKDNINASVWKIEF